MARKMLVLMTALLPVAGGAGVLLPRDSDALGRLATAKLPGETVSYAYNVRNALTAITSPRFSQQLRYAAGAANPCYNGNIAEAITQGNKYAYTYDNANRLTAAKYTPSAGNADYSATYAYDRNSNITALERKGMKDVFGNYGLVDDLTMIYSGNRLWRVTDHAGEVLLENSGNLRNPEIFDPTETQFGYDSNGNTVKDLSRNIETMSYNSINLPLSTQLVQGTDRLTGATTRRSVGYTYDASGVRHRVIHTTQPMFGTRPLKIATADTTDYVGNYVILNGQIDKILTPYGYMQGGRHHTFLHDYQGNVVAVIAGDSVAQRNSYYPYGLPHYTGIVKKTSFSSSSMTANPYKYGGKEYDTFGGTDLYDFHARYHAPSTGRFMTVDPMAEKYPSISPYMYCAGNPVLFIDPSGMKLELKGAIEDLEKIKSICQDRLGETANVSLNDSGEMSLERNSDIAFSDSHQEAFFSTLNQITESNTVVSLNVVSNDENVLIGDAEHSKIDVADIEAFGDGEFVTASSVFLHEAFEQYRLAANPQSQQNFNDALSVAHNSAANIEYNVTGYYPHPTTRNLFLGIMLIPIQQARGVTRPIGYVEVGVKNNNVEYINRINHSLW